VRALPALACATVSAVAALQARIEATCAAVQGPAVRSLSSIATASAIAALLGQRFRREQRPSSPTRMRFVEQLGFHGNHAGLTLRTDGLLFSLSPPRLYHGSLSVGAESQSSPFDLQVGASGPCAAVVLWGGGLKGGGWVGGGGERERERETTERYGTVASEP
jgi:hypothetical protein